MKRKIPALLLALLLVFSAALPAGAAAYRCAVRSWPPDCWKQFFCDRFGIGCGNQTPGAPSESRNSPPSRRSRLNRNSPLSRPAVHPYPAMSSRSLRSSMQSAQNTASRP